MVWKNIFTGQKGVDGVSYAFRNKLEKYVPEPREIGLLFENFNLLPKSGSPIHLKLPFETYRDLRKVNFIIT